MSAKLIWVEAENPLDSGVKLSSRVVDWAWRGEAVAKAYAEQKSLRKVAKMFGLNHEKVRTLVARYSTGAPSDTGTCFDDLPASEEV